MSSSLLTVSGQNSISFKLKDSKTLENLMGATAYIKSIQLGASTNSSGLVKIENIPDGKFEIVFSYVGYEKKKLECFFPTGHINPIEIFLKNEHSELGEVIISTTRNNSRIEEAPISIEVIGEEEVNEEGAIRPSNVSKLLTESSSIQVQSTSAINGNVSIRLQGLDGKYTQILKDGFPLYGGFSQGLSLLQIPPLDLKQVEIIKGSSSSLYGGDAIGGIINLVSKQPIEKGEAQILYNQTSLKGTDLNLYFSNRRKKTGFTFLSNNNLQKAIDINKDGYSSLPASKTISLLPVFYYYFDSTAILSLGFNTTYDDRKGGDMMVLNNHIDSLHNFFEKNISSRVSSQLKFEKKLVNNRVFVFKNSISRFERIINETATSFKGKQNSSYTELAYNQSILRHNLVLGANLSTDLFSEDSIRSNKSRGYDYNTFGVFLQDDWKLTKKTIVQSGIRTDYQNSFGWFVLPRLAFKYNFSSNFYTRSAIGLGYKLPSIFSTSTEQVGLNNIDRLSDSVIPEGSVGGNIDLNYKILVGEGLITFNQSFFYTQINNPLILEGFSLFNQIKPIVTNGLESNLRYRLDEFQVISSYTYVIATRKYDPLHSIFPMTPRHKVTVDILFEEEEEYAIAFEGFYLSSMLRDSDTKTRDYVLFGIIAQKYFKYFTLVANAENLFDVRQSKFENIVINTEKTPGFRQIYAPLEGRMFSLAIKIKL